MKRLVFVLTCLALAASLAPLHGHADKPKKDSVEALMKKKLGQAQKALEGVAVQDFNKIADSADELIEISKQAQWKVLKTPLYDLYSADFRTHAEDLIKAAKKKNIDAAALAYVELTLTCVKCHKHVREKRITRLDQEKPLRAIETPLPR
jgi:hypothetical protein